MPYQIGHAGQCREEVSMLGHFMRDAYALQGEIKAYLPDGFGDCDSVWLAGKSGEISRRVKSLEDSIRKEKIRLAKDFGILFTLDFFSMEDNHVMMFFYQFFSQSLVNADYCYQSLPAQLVEFHIACADRFLELCDFDQAIAAWESALRLDPDNKAIHAKLYGLLAEVWSRSGGELAPDPVFP
jgi:hypothetical protein